MLKYEKLYDDVSYSLKESAGFPIRYFNLTVDQRLFVDSIFEKANIKDAKKILEKVRNIQSAIEDIDYNLSTIEEEIESGD